MGNSSTVLPSAAPIPAKGPTWKRRPPRPSMPSPPLKRCWPEVLAPEPRAGHFDAVAALGAGGGGTGKGVGFFGTRARADTVVFVVDMSGSMNDGRRFDRAVEELIRSLNALVPAQRFFVFFYNGVTYPMLDMRTAKLMPANPGNRNKVIKWIKTLEPNGDTAPEERWKGAPKLKPQVIYFLTDGEIPETTRDTAKKFNHEHKTVIHTIAFVTEEGADMLRGIAKDNRGKYRYVH